MAKTLKINKKSSAITRSKKKLHSKDCFINIVRLSKEEIDMYTKSKVVVANFDLKISNDFLQIGDKRKHSASQTYNLTLKKRLSELVLEHCDETSQSSVRCKANVSAESIAPHHPSPDKSAASNNSTPLPLSKCTSKSFLNSDY